MGIGLMFISFLLIWTWLKPIELRKPLACLVSSMVFGPISFFLVWASTHKLGKQWRLQVALSADHKLALIVGTEIRVRAEERLLEQRFQAEFRKHRSRVRSYIPFVR
jgi:protein-S-isoprenylcysteine O-methyltransferase Ste14